jgi:hypothetical protein
MHEFAMLVIGFLFGIVVATVLIMRHIRREVALLRELLEDEVLAPLRKYDAPRTYRLRSILEASFRRFEQLL